MELITVKVLSSLALLFLTFFASMLPLCVFRQPLSLYQPRNRHSTRKRVMSFLSCFAGGVFLGTCLLHLFPDVGHQVDVIVKSLKLNPRCPLTEFLLGFGFLTILIIEQIILSCKENDDFCEEDPIVRSSPSVNKVPEQDVEEEVPHYVSTTYGAIQGNNEPSEYNISFPQDQHSHSIFRSLLLLLALSLHSVFEGLAIGLQTTVRDNIRILVAVLIHKCIIAFSLGLNLTHSDMKLFSVVKSNIFFSLTSPIGIIIGLLVMNLVTGVALLITSCILQGLAAGTFLYITLFEVLPKELSSNQDRLVKVLSVIVGYCIVSFLIIFLPD